MGKIKGSFAKTYDRFVKRPTLLPSGLLDLVKSAPARDILEFACGTGTVAVGLAREGFEVTGVDYSPEMLAAARSKANEHKASVEFIEADISRVKLDRQFDLVLCLGNAIPQFKSERDLGRLFANCHRHLRPGGRLVFQQLNYDRILKDRPGTFAVDLDRDVARFKQYRYHKSLIDFYVTIVDGANIPPGVTTSKGTLKPWTRADHVRMLRKSGFGKIKALGNYAGERFTMKSKDMIIIAERVK